MNSATRPETAQERELREAAGKEPRASDDLIRNANGSPIVNEWNARKLLADAEDFTGLHYDTFRQEVRIDNRPWTDVDDRKALLYLQHLDDGLPRVTLAVAKNAIEALAHDRPRDSLENFVRGAGEWDGTPRIERIFHEGFGARDNAGTRAASKNLLVAAVARALRPGCKVDNLLVVEGAQGILKSTGIHALGGEFHREVTAPLGSPDSIREVRSTWFAELSELRPLVSRDSETVKNFLSRTEDPLVEKWKTRVEAYPRRCVFVGSTNEPRYWNDPSGARRLVPIRAGEVGPIRPDFIAANRLQWIAEARTLFEQGAHWWDYPPETDDERELRQHVDPWEEPISAFLDQKDSVTVNTILTFLAIPTGEREDRDEKRVCAILRRAHFKAGPRVRVNGELQRPWIRSDP